jgi:glucokinase
MVTPAERGERTVLGIDLGGTRLRVARIDLNGQIQDRTTGPTRPAPTAEALLSKLATSIDRLRDSSVVGIGLGTPNSLQAEGRTIALHPAEAGDEYLDLEQQIGTQFGLPVVRDNDGTAGAFGEKTFGAGRPYDSFIYISIGTGVGGGLVIGGQLYRGAHGRAGEFGHLRCSLCLDGGEAYLGEVASGTALKRRAGELMRSGAKTLVRNMCRNDPARLQVQHVIRAAVRGDDLSRQLLREMGVHLGRALSGAVDILDPEAIIVGGGVVSAGNFLLEPIRETLAKATVAGLHLPVLPSGTGQDAGILGAASLIIEHLKLLDGEEDEEHATKPRRSLAHY